jgi:hypothetical protein
MSTAKGRLTGKVRISGAINDVEFSATGESDGDPQTGDRPRLLS